MVKITLAVSQNLIREFDQELGCQMAAYRPSHIASCQIPDLILECRAAQEA